MSATSRQQLPLVTEFGICGLFAVRATMLELAGFHVPYAFAGQSNGRLVVEAPAVVQAVVERARKGGST
jgi:hypothetical protein